MDGQSDKSVFISYRRRDTLPLAMYVRDAIERNFRNVDVFVDIDVIEAGDEWPPRVREGLERASVLIALIGPKWLKATDGHGQSRLHNPKDWVRREIEFALKNLKIIPLLFSKAQLPEKGKLPRSLARLPDIQASTLREETFRDDVAHLLTRLQGLGLGFERTGEEVEYPPPRKKAAELSDVQIKLALKKLPGWRFEVTDDARGGKRKELVRAYTFDSPPDALHFMFTAARYITRLDHHPDWRNVWRTVAVRLATWDIGHKPSAFDVRLAEYLEKLYRDYKSATLKG